MAIKSVQSNLSTRVPFSPNAPVSEKGKIAWGSLLLRCGTALPLAAYEVGRYWHKKHQITTGFPEAVLVGAIALGVVLYDAYWKTDKAVFEKHKAVVIAEYGKDGETVSTSARNFAAQHLAEVWKEIPNINKEDHTARGLLDDCADFSLIQEILRNGYSHRTGRLWERAIEEDDNGHVRLLMLIAQASTKEFSDVEKEVLEKRGIPIKQNLRVVYQNEKRSLPSWIPLASNAPVMGKAKKAQVDWLALGTRLALPLGLIKWELHRFRNLWDRGGLAKEEALALCVAGLAYLTFDTFSKTYQALKQERGEGPHIRPAILGGKKLNVEKAAFWAAATGVALGALYVYSSCAFFPLVLTSQMVKQVAIRTAMGYGVALAFDEYASLVGRALYYPVPIFLGGAKPYDENGKRDEVKAVIQMATPFFIGLPTAIIALLSGRTALYGAAWFVAFLGPMIEMCLWIREEERRQGAWA